jgi:hypothetical protein
MEAMAMKEIIELQRTFRDPMGQIRRQGMQAEIMSQIHDLGNRTLYRIKLDDGHIIVVLEEDINRLN